MKATGNRFRITNENIEGEFYGNTENSPTKNTRNTENIPDDCSSGMRWKGFPAGCQRSQPDHIVIGHKLQITI